MTATPPAWVPLSGTAHRIAVETLLHGPLARGELARRLGLTAGAITRLTRPMIDSGLLVEREPVRPRGGGRPLQPLDVVPDSHHFIGVKLTATEAHAVLTTLRARIVADEVVRLPGREPAAVVATVADTAARLAERAPGVTALGVGLGGRTRDRATVESALFLGWDGVPLAGLLAEATGFPTVVENDVVAWTEAEHWFGAGRRSRSFALLTVGSGVGYGLVAHGARVESPDAAIGLLGHVPLVPHGPLCPEGHHGCATAMLTIPAICAAVAAGRHRPCTYSEVFRLYRAGDAVARRVVTESATALGRLIALIANTTMAECIVLAGEGIRLADEARHVVDAEVAAHRHPLAAPVRLAVGTEDFRQWALGAAVVAIQTFVLGSR